MLKILEMCVSLMSLWGCVALGVFVIAMICLWRGRHTTSVTLRRVQWLLALLPAILGSWGCYHEFTEYRKIADLMELSGASAEQVAMVSQGGIEAAWRSLIMGVGTSAVLWFFTRRRHRPSECSPPARPQVAEN